MGYNNNSTKPQSLCIFFVVISCAFLVSANKPKHYKYVDLSYSISNSTIFYPGVEGFSLKRDHEGWKNNGSYWYSSFSFTMGEHGGTHLDAPYHFIPDGWTVDQIPEDHLIDVPAIVVDVQAKLEASGLGGNYKITVDDLIEHERKFQRNIEAGSLVLFHTGWSKYWPNRNVYLGYEEYTDADNNTLSRLRFPGLSVDAIKWLAEERQIVGVGIDSPSVDQGMDTNYSVHVYSARSKIYNLENVANLHLLLETRKNEPGSGIPFISRDITQIRAFVLPLKIVGASGAPTRILAKVPLL